MLVMWIDLDERFVSATGNGNWTRELRELPDHVDAINVMMDFTGDGSITYYQTEGVRGRHYWKYAVRRNPCALHRLGCAAHHYHVLHSAFPTTWESVPCIPPSASAT